MIGRVLPVFRAMERSFDKQIHSLSQIDGCNTKVLQCWSMKLPHDRTKTLAGVALVSAGMLRKKLVHQQEIGTGSCYWCFSSLKLGFCRTYDDRHPEHQCFVPVLFSRELQAPLAQTTVRLRPKKEAYGDQKEE